MGERRLREAMAAGEFDNLPLAGRPLDLSEADDPDWWVERHLRDNGVSGEDILPARRSRPQPPPQRRWWSRRQG